MKLRSVKVYDPVKSILRTMRSTMAQDLKSESEVIAFLYEVYKDNFEKMTVTNYNKYVDKAKYRHLVSNDKND